MRRTLFSDLKWSVLWPTIYNGNILDTRESFLDVHYFMGLFKMLNSLLVIASMNRQSVWVTEGLEQLFHSDIR